MTPQPPSPLAAETATIPDQVPVSRRGLVSGVAGATTPLALAGGLLVYRIRGVA